MGYSERLEQSMKNFDREVDKLTKINELIKEIDDLTDLFSDAGKDFQGAMKRLTELKAGLEKDCAALSKFAANEAAARQKLVTDIHNTITADSRQIIDGVTTPLAPVKSALAETAQKLDALIAAHKTSQEKFLADTKALLETFAKHETEERERLVVAVHEKIVADARRVLDGIAAPLNETNAALQKTCKEIDDFTKLHKASQEKFLADTENLLIKYNTKNLETYNNLLAALSNKIDLAKGALESSAANQATLLNELSRKTDLHRRELENSLITRLDEQNKKLSAEVAALKEKLSVLSYIKAATTAAVGFGILSCLIQFVK